MTAAIVYALIESISEVSRHSLKLCQQTVLKIHVNFTKPLSIVSVLPFGAQFRRWDHWSLFFLEKRARCHGECSSIQGDDRRIFPCWYLQ